MVDVFTLYMTQFTMFTPVNLHRIIVRPWEELCIEKDYFPGTIDYIDHYTGWLERYAKKKHKNAWFEAASCQQQQIEI